MNFEEDVYLDDFNDPKEEAQTRSNGVIPEFSIELLKKLDWYGPIISKELGILVLEAALVFPESGKAVVVDLKNKHHKYLLLDFTTACASYYTSYRTVVKEDGSVFMIHPLPRGIIKVVPVQ